VLLALFEGVPQIVHIEEPRRGIQFGVRLDSTPGSSVFHPWIPPRNAQDPQQLINDKVPVPCRPGSPGVLDLRHLGRALAARGDTHLSGDPPSSAEFALELLRFPFRQVFGDVAHPVGHLIDIFRPTVFINATNKASASLVARFREGLA